MKNRLNSVVLGLMAGLMLVPALVRAEETKKIYLFYGVGCAHCALVDEYFRDNGIYDRYPVEKKEIYSNRENAAEFNRLLDEAGIAPNKRGVPTAVIGDTVLVGDREIMADFAETADKYLSQEQTVQSGENEPPEVSPAEPGLTLAAVIAGAVVDAINPCAFAVLIILMTTILAAGDTGKALKAGLAFSLSIFISYFLMGLGLYKALAWMVSGVWFYRVVGWVAIVMGLLNLKDFIWYGRGVLMEVPMSWRPKMKSLIRSVTNPTGAFLIGFLVSLFLLPCTSGPYIVVLGMLAKQPFDFKAMTYLWLYNLIFVAPMILITLSVYRGLDPNKAEELRQRQLRRLHLIAGAVMLAMGVVILRYWV